MPRMIRCAHGLDAPSIAWSSNLYQSTKKSFLPAVSEFRFVFVFVWVCFAVRSCSVTNKRFPSLIYRDGSVNVGVSVSESSVIDDDVDQWSLGVDMWANENGCFRENCHRRRRGPMGVRSRPPSQWEWVFCVGTILAVHFPYLGRSPWSELSGLHDVTGVKEKMKQISFNACRLSYVYIWEFEHQY